MKTPEYAPWEQVPTHLDYYKLLQYPFEPVFDYFEAATPVRHLQYLRNWRHCALSNEYIFHKALGPGKLVEIYLLNVRLMEILYLLTGERMYYRNRNGTKNEQLPSDEDLTNEAKEWLWFPDNLDSKSLMSPYDYLKIIFVKYPLPSLRSTMLTLLQSALSADIAEYTVSIRQINSFFDIMEKICSTAWLINQRDTSNTYCKGDPCPDKGIDKVNFAVL